MESPNGSEQAGSPLDDPRVLSALVAAFGRSGRDLWATPGRVRATLSDVLGPVARTLRAPIDLLEVAVEESVPDRLLAGTPTAELAAELADRGIDPVVAVATVETWQRALQTATAIPDPAESLRPGGTVLPKAELPGTVLPGTVLPGTVLPDAALTPEPTRRSSRILIAAAAALVVTVAAVLAGTVGSNGDDDVASDTTRRSVTTATTSSTSTTVAVTSPPTTTIPVNAEASGPPTVALLHQRWGSLVDDPGCTGTDSGDLATVVCSITDAHGEYVVDFAAWTDNTGPPYGVEHEPDRAQAESQGTWPAGAAARGEESHYRDESLGECIDWSYAGSQFEVSLCADDAATTTAAAAAVQAL